MSSVRRILCALAAVAMDASAGAGDSWPLNDYSTDARDSSQALALYGFQAFSNPSSQATINVSGGSVNLIARSLASDGTEGFSANIGLVHPLSPDRSVHDLTGLTSITFQYQNDQTITGALSVHFGSDAYTEAMVKAGTVYSDSISGTNALAGGTTWKSGEVLIADFATPSGWTSIPDDYPTMDSVLKRVRDLQFVPKTLYAGEGSYAGKPCTLCTSPTMTSLTLRVKNIVLHGVTGSAPWPNPTNVGCEDSRPFLPFTLVGENALSFATFSDFDTLPENSQDPAVGRSAVAYTIDPDSSFLAIRAGLNKRVGGLYHDGAGWAGVSTKLGFDTASRIPSVVVHGCSGKDDTTWTAPRFSTIGFQLADLGINIERVRKITFRVRMKGVSDSASHQVQLPVSELAAAGLGGKYACIRPVDLVQPDWIESSQRVDFDPSLMQQLIWEAKIADSASPEIDTASANFALALDALFIAAPAIVWADCPSHVIGKSKPFPTYANGSLRLDGFAGSQRFEVRDLGGRVVASFGAASTVPLALSRGTYLLTAIGDGGAKTTKFSVLGN